MAHNTTGRSYEADPGHQPFDPDHPLEYRICRYCIQPVSAPYCSPQPGNPERPPLNPAALASIMKGIPIGRTMGSVIATAPPDDDPVEYRIARTLTRWLPMPEGMAKRAAQFIAGHFVTPDKRDAIIAEDRSNSVQVLYEDGLLVGRWPDGIDYIPGRFLVAAEVAADNRTVAVTYGTRPTQTKRLRPSRRGPELAAALNRYANYTGRL